MLRVVKYDPLHHTRDLEQFCARAGAAGLRNNSSLKAMKVDTIHYWVGYLDTHIISVAGAEPWDDSSWRVAVRVATLPEYHDLLPYARHFAGSSIMFRYVQRAGIEYAHSTGATRLFVSTNVDNHAGPWMTRVDKHVQRLARMGIFEYEETRELNYVMQNIYRLNYDRYIEYADFLEETYGNHSQE